MQARRQAGQEGTRKGGRQTVVEWREREREREGGREGEGEGERERERERELQGDKGEKDTNIISLELCVVSHN